MGTVEIGLALKYGIPLAFKMWDNDKSEAETTAAVTAAITNLKDGVPDMGAKLLKANKEETDGIVEGLFGVITGTADGVSKLIGSLLGLLFK